MSLSRYILLASVLITLPTPLVAQEKNWIGEQVLHNKPAKQIKFGDRIGDQEVSFEFSGIWPFTVRDEKEGWLRIHDRRHEGWVDKADFVLAREAIPYFTRRIDANPKDSFAFNMRGAAWLQKKEADKAIADFDASLRLNPADAGSLNNRGIAWKDKKDYDKAIADFSEAIRINPNGPIAYLNRGNTWRVKNNIDKAISDYNEAIRIDPRYAIAWYNRGIAHFLKKEYDSAVKDYDESIRLDPKSAMAFYERGLTWRYKKDYDKAIKNYDDAIRLDPKNASTYFSRGVAKVLKNDYAAAIMDYDEAIRLNPKYAKAYHERGLANVRLKKYVKALADYESSVRIDGKSAPALADQAWLLATCADERFRDGKKAVDLAMRACELSKFKVPTQLSALAAAYAEVGNFKEAINWQTKALENADYAKSAGTAARQRLKLYEAGMPYHEGAAQPKQLRQNGPC